MRDLREKDVVELMERQASQWIMRRDGIDDDPDNEIDALVDSKIMYQLLADMALQHAELVRRIK